LTAGRDTARGVVATAGAFLFWGLVPLYWRLLDAVPATELLAHRIAWSAPCLAVLLALGRRFPEVRRAAASPRTMATLLATTVLIAVNWLTFLWAINNGHLLDASLGYYVNPLVSVLLGFVFLGERLRRLPAAAVGLAVAGVALLSARHGLPWVSLVLAFSFGFYGLLRKVVDARPMVGLSVEIALLTPLAVGYLMALRPAGRGAFTSGDAGTSLLLAAAGPITVFPLLWFNQGVRSLSLATVGMLQYLAPTGQFILGVTVFGEPFGASQLVAFALIWTALALYTLDLRRTLARQRRLEPVGARSR
jgi:chloramphenicol-sensitive protein RarD